MYYCVQLDSGWQNGVKIYPSYSNLIQAGPIGFAAVSQFNLGMLQGAILSPSAIPILTAIAITALILPRRHKGAGVETKKRTLFALNS